MIEYFGIFLGFFKLLGVIIVDSSCLEGTKVIGFKFCQIRVEGIDMVSHSISCFKVLGPGAGIEPNLSHQVGLAGGGDLPAPGFLLFEANPGAGIIPALVVAEGPALGPKSYTQALVGLAGPGQAIFSCSVNPDQAHPPLSNLGSPIGDPFFNQVLWAQESLSSQSKNGDQIGKTPKTPEAKPAKINDQLSQDRPSEIQTTFPENPKNNHEAANQTAEPEMPSLATQIASEEYPEAPACE
ncbi:hypothetical protein DSO57_1033573 [Entomophthora muscae]|uniref:Uncharacterized protein n=1 Tax=Entomophthora muscae TaxID=34485 RepID=A0ACC2TLT1_9FUNG|nr:hypothetical protein DSO57_1033573 [Entomophthora muscae]